MLRVVTSLALVLSLFGCGTSKGERVELTITQLSVSACHPLATPLYLVADPQYGTATKFNLGDTLAEPLYWPTGYTGWRVGSEVEVRDTSDKVVAVTGHRYDIYVTVDRGVEAPGRIAMAGCIRSSELGD
jgi:hypothetical protein